MSSTNKYMPAHSDFTRWVVEDVLARSNYDELHVIGLAYNQGQTAIVIGATDPELKKDKLHWALVEDDDYIRFYNAKQFYEADYNKIYPQIRVSVYDVMYNDEPEEMVRSAIHNMIDKLIELWQLHFSKLGSESSNLTLTLSLK